MESVYIIAEAGVNHNGVLENAFKLVDMAYECGADAIKFQTFKAEESTGKFAEMAEYQKDNVTLIESQFEMIKKLELPFNDFRKIQEYCKGKGIDFISTPDGIESLNYLIELNVPLIKIGSTEVTNLKFLREIALCGKPIILSTGMSTLGEVEKAIETIYLTGNKKLELMHCVTDYPTRSEDLNLLVIKTMAAAFRIPVGLSDHTIGVEGAIAAVALGARVIEKHITLDTSLEGPDHKASMDTSAFMPYVRAIRNTVILLGDGIKKPTQREIEIMEQVRRSIVASRNIKNGEIIKSEDISVKRPGYGIKQEFLSIVIGRELKRDIEKDEPILWRDI